MIFPKINFHKFRERHTFQNFRQFLEKLKNCKILFLHNYHLYKRFFSLSSSNKEVQEAFQKHRGLPFLIRMLDLNKLTLTQKKGLYAVSAVIRGNHHVQSEFVKYGGLAAILNMIKNGESNTIKVKAVTLMYDLIVEQNEVLQRMFESGKMKPDKNSE